LVGVLILDDVRRVPTSVSPIDVKEMTESRFSKTSWEMMTDPSNFPGLGVEVTLNWPTEELTEPNLWPGVKVTLEDEMPTRLENELTAPL